MTDDERCDEFVRRCNADPSLTNENAREILSRLFREARHGALDEAADIVRANTPPQPRCDCLHCRDGLTVSVRRKAMVDSVREILARKVGSGGR